MYVGSQEGSEFAYGQQLRNDVINALEKYKMKWTSFDFGTDHATVGIPNQTDPIVACGTSASVACLARKFREEKIRSQFFAFGSNSNLLEDSLVNTIVVCDLDREDANPIARDEIDHFSAKYSETSDPDLSTMNAVSTLCNVLTHNTETIASSELPQQRFQLLNILKSGAHQALLGQISFSESGEMAGYENISVLKVFKKKRGYMFRPVKREEKPLLQNHNWWKDKALLILTIVGSVASTASLVYIFL